MKMKRKKKTNVLVLALAMCLLLLSACGADNTQGAQETAALESEADAAEQQTENEQEEQPEQEEPEETQEPEQEEPEEAEEPEPEEAEEQNNAGTELLVLLQEEYENGFFVGEGAKHTYYEYVDNNNSSFIYNGTVYIADNLTNSSGDVVYTAYDISSKELKVLEGEELYYRMSAFTGTNFMDGIFYVLSTDYYQYRDALFYTYDADGALLNKFQDDTVYEITYAAYFDKGILCLVRYIDDSYGYLLLSYDLEKIAEISIPQCEVEHGLKADMNPQHAAGYIMAAANGTVYIMFVEEDSWYRLNIDTYEWEDTGEAVPDVSKDMIYALNGTSFCGKYWGNDDGIYDIITGEQIFEWGELYAPKYGGYYGGDKYLGYNKRNNEYRWVNLTDLSMSDPLPFPEGKSVTILNDTYCIYKDQYGWFLWNYNDGTEETIVMYEN
ncbi:MAG: hypothetical protein NC231_02430 [Bacillus sp. (in: Bacteria)]|nr:hypothetical protein [Bacillus sp. (in: firmicutes)]MCM1425555.1 hypothetical protein [Eubacterium sp.]